MVGSSFGERVTPSAPGGTLGIRRRPRGEEEAVADTFGFARNLLQEQPWPIAKDVFIIGEIGINHNGDIDLAKQLIDLAKSAGCDAVKFQKRTIDIVYTEEYLASPRESP